jgi:hypothetical protein
VSEIQKFNDLEIDHDMDFQRKEWSVERWGWVFMALLAIAGLLGLFGQGPLSQTTVENGPVQIEYGRFERLLAPVQWNIQLNQEAVKNGEARVRVDESLLNQYDILHISPQPDREDLSPDYITFVFKSPQPGQKMSINFNLESTKPGKVSGQVGLENGPMLILNQFIYP